MKKLPITEQQQNGVMGSSWPSRYRYVRYDKQTGLHLFDDGTGKLELFAKHKPGRGDAGWHLKRGAYVYEFCTSLNEREESAQ